MKTTVFFSWASDPPPAIGRNFIERALKRALAVVAEDSEVAMAIRGGLSLDRDTQDSPGMPPITDTIFEKIDQATAYVCDFTLVATRINGKGMSPNPNVLTEYGWALKTLGHKRIVAVMNTAFGEATEMNMPFNMRHVRRPITYHLPPDADDEAKAKIRGELQQELEKAISLILKNLPADSSEPKPTFPTIEAHPAVSRWEHPGLSLGMRDGIPPFLIPGDLFMESKPLMWLRLIPASGSDRELSIQSIRNLVKTDGLVPLITLEHGGDMGWFRNEKGAGAYRTTDNVQLTDSATMVFTNGELWAVDTAFLDVHEPHKTIPSIEDLFLKATTNYARFLGMLGVHPPFRWIAGMEGIRGRKIVFPAARGHRNLSIGGACASDRVCAEGTVESMPPSANVLSPFFRKLFDQCGTDRPHHLDGGFRD